MAIQTTPAYQKIYNVIKQKIDDGLYKVGEILPSEMELEKLFTVSRTPVRQALKQLENNGIIYRVQGKGSFVSNRQPKESWTSMSGFRNHYSNEWEKISVRTIEGKVVKNPLFAKLLEVDEEENLIYLKRIRYLNNQPMFYLEHYLRPLIPLKDYMENTSFSSVQQLLKEKKNIDILEVEDEIEAVIADPYVAGALQIPDSSAVLKGTRISYDENKVPIDLNIFHINTKTWKYHSYYRY
ncbi:GntR family transcriptional regulator [Cytobacillus horneckiae]|uniref:GntR family transcriptional regulator n=1 Tax=Cytobacillus horneckiae TaxID=549687 RepID=A0A2N0ZG64_9BACI|nr:GntR family transcriptional regulator [Cytobacillus horneckiae]MBN6886139.1 GntR family transcriptional regulator [Cytobacillus horneckiae]MCM3176439.1 GntR family transcriptional regulator [Cytobacillus horneckiae]MEC1155724.1 GntR family transcriptional regulator [Cytobacillus horneckiae]MED2939263.1 GntR family transcriptional regulator [Cytobacillus horneckiae]PKG28488.1 GntR family transcriptional regulator [Cytobacillus horneckiae]